MHLRSRNIKANAESKLNDKPSFNNGRSILGDVSNKRNLKKDDVEDITRKERVSKNSKRNSHYIANTTTGNDENINCNKLSISKGTNNIYFSRKRASNSSTQNLKRSNTEFQNERKKKTRSNESSDDNEAPYDELFNEERHEDGVEPETSLMFPKGLRLYYQTEFVETPKKLSLSSLDNGFKDDVLMAVDYVTDLFQYQYQRETTSRPTTYMCEQREINARMRAILVDWLVEVHMKFRLVPETLYLCINIIDRYCNLVQVARNKLQLVGVTALLIACKYEEIYPPEVRDCVYITDRAYQRQEVLNMEQDVLSRLRFKVTVPTAYPFLKRFLNITKCSMLIKHAANYYMERTLQEHDLLRYRPSLVGAAVVALALNNPDIYRNDNILETSDFPGLEGTQILLEYTGFGNEELLECAAIIARKIEEEPVTASKRQLVAVKRKYDNRRYQYVSTTVELPSASYIPIGTKK